MKLGLVLGAGGTVGVSYHAGVLRALEQVAGLVPASADLVVGTSAGSVAAAYLRSGFSTEEFFQWALGTHPRLVVEGGGPTTRRDIYAPNFANPVDLVRRGVGSAYVMSRSAVRLPGPVVPKALRRAFPGGLFSPAEGRRRFTGELPDAWPDRPLYLCAVDISSGRRVVLGRPGSPPATLPEAVLASCAIPGIYEPVKVGKLTLVDGGAHSTTNLDLAAKAGCELIVGVAPMAYDTAQAPSRLRQLSRRMASRALAAEVAIARERGAKVLLVRPNRGELRVHGLDLMRAGSLEAVARSAYEATARTLDTERFRNAFDALRG